METGSSQKNDDSRSAPSQLCLGFFFTEYRVVVFFAEATTLPMPVVSFERCCANDSNPYYGTFREKDPRNRSQMVKQTPKKK